MTESVLSDKQIGVLTEAALAARSRSYCPYSHFAVGAALLTQEGRVYTGCNIENASYGAANCAERTAIFKAVSEGERHFAAIAIAGGPQGQPAADFCPPCGICRQVMAEFCDLQSFEVLLVTSSGEMKAFRLEELLPEAFSLA